jgi:signal transduction histidine kinase
MADKPIIFSNELDEVQSTIAWLLGSDLGPEQSLDVMQMTNGIVQLVALIDEAYETDDPLDPLSKMGHAMRNALNGTFGYSLVLADFPHVHPKEHLSPEQIAIVKTVSQHTENLLRLITEINIYAKLRRQRFPAAVFAPTQIDSILQNLVDEFGLSQTTETDGPTTLNTDRLQLAHALRGLFLGLYGLINRYPLLTTTTQSILLQMDTVLPSTPAMTLVWTPNLLETSLHDLRLHNSFMLLRHMGTTLRYGSPNQLEIRFRPGVAGNITED